MPDIPPLTDIAAAIGTVVVTIIVGLASRKGEKDKRELPTREPESAGVVMGIVEQGVQHDILIHTERTADGIEEIVDAIQQWIVLDNQAKQAAKDRTTDHRLEMMEANQANIKNLISDVLKKMDTEEKSSRERRVRRDEN